MVGNLFLAPVDGGGPCHEVEVVEVIGKDLHGDRDPILGEMDIVLLDYDRSAGNQTGEELPKHVTVKIPTLGKVDEKDLDWRSIPSHVEHIAWSNRDVV